MDIKIATYYNNAKGAYSFVFDDGCYYDSTMDAYENLKEVYEKTGVKIKITSAQTLNFLHEKLIDMWKKLFDEGYFDLSAHSVDHCLGYNRNTPFEKLDEDARLSKEGLEKLYGRKIITFVTPGGGDDSEGLQVLKKYYYANRNGHDRINDTYNMDMYDVGSFTARFAYDLQPYIDSIDNTIRVGGWSVQINHWITKKEQDTHHAQKYETFLPQCMYLAEKAQKNEVWACSFNDMIKYIYLRDNSELLVSEENGNVKITLKTDLDKEIFDHPVSVICDGRIINIKANETVTL